MPTAPDNVLQLLELVQQPLRLNVLLALEGRERSQAELREELGAKAHDLDYALKRLREGGLVVVVREERTSPTRNTLRAIYATPRDDWSEFVATVARWAPR